MTIIEPRHEDRALRADAQRNLLRVLDAAREVFAEQGLDAPVTEIAERAHVGVGTIFRRFPTKDDLLAAVFEQRIGQLIAAADNALAGGDPGVGLRTFMRAAAAAQICDRGFCEAAGSELFGREPLRGLVDDLLERMRVLLEQAQAAGAVRRDVTLRDIPVLLMGIAQVGLMLEGPAPGAWHRYLDLVLDGLQQEGARPLSRKPLTSRQFEAIRDGRRAKSP